MNYLFSYLLSLLPATRDPKTDATCGSEDTMKALSTRGVAQQIFSSLPSLSSLSFFLNASFFFFF